MAATAQYQLQLAQIAGANGGSSPILLLDAHVQAHSHRLQRFGQSAQGAETAGHFSEQPGLVCFGQARGEPPPGLLEKTSDRLEVGADGAELLRAVEAAESGSAEDAVPVNLGACFLIHARLTAVGHRLVERLEAGKSFRPVRHARFQVLVEPPVRSAPRLRILRAEFFREVLAY